MEDAVYAPKNACQEYNDQAFKTQRRNPLRFLESNGHWSKHGVSIVQRPR